MTAIHEIAVSVPAGVPLASLAESLGLSSMDVRVFRRLHGLDRVAMATGQTWTEQMLRAASGLTTLTAEAGRVRYLIAARSALPLSYTRAFPLSDIAATLGLRDDVICFALAEHACASGLLAIDLAGRMLARDRDPEALALVLAGEKAGPPEMQHIPNTSILAEGSAAVIVSADGGRDRVLSYASRTGDGTTSYDESYHDTVATTLDEAVAAAGLGWDDVKIVLPHNVNRVSWVRIAGILGLPIERIYLDNVPAFAHSFSADPFINYIDARSAGRLEPGDAYVMAAAGIRTVASAMVVRH